MVGLDGCSSFWKHQMVVPSADSHKALFIPMQLDSFTAAFLPHQLLRLTSIRMILIMIIVTNIT